MLITQLIEYHADGDSWKDVERAKDEKLMELVRDLRVEASPESEHSSILIFVGSKNSAKSVASRIAGISDAAGDVVLAQQCLERGVGFHYRGAPEGQTTLRKFNTREIGILVATSGLATGVNTPARAVIVRDLTLGTSPIEVSQLQQMFGRAGRAGHESDGYAYVLIPEGDHAAWQQRLDAGYRVDSKLAGKEADAALAEIHLGNISTAEELELWYSTTLAAAQVGAPLSAREVIKRLTYASLVKEDETGVVAITDLGRLTVQLMVDVASVSAIRKELGVSTPTSADEAERLVLQAVCCGATALANRPVNPKPWDVPISTVMARHHIAEGWGEFGSRLSLMACYAALEQGGSNAVAELALRDVLDEAPRYFTWVGELGRLGYTSWPSIVATDIGERLSNYRLSNPEPARGSGRVLKFLRAIVEPDEVDAFIKDRWSPTSGIRLPELFPTRPVDYRVLPANLSTTHQGVLRANIPRCEVLEGVLEVEIGIEGVIERSETFANSGMAVVHATGSQGSHVSMPIPSGAARCQQVALEVIAFSRSDATYSSVISNVSVMLREEDLLGQRQAAARKMLPDVRDTALVYAGKERRSMFRKKREQAELDNLRGLGNNSGLGPVSYELTNGLEPLLAVWSIREAISAICSNATSGLVPRSPAAVLRSGTASGQELALVRYALIKEAGLQAELVAVGDLAHLHCAVRLGEAYFVLDDELPQGRIIRLGVGRALALSTLPPRPAEPAVEATLRMGWLAEFLENRPDQLAAED